MRSGDLFLEVSSSNQATSLIKLQKLAHLDITVAPHSNLNFSRGVISPADFLNVSTEEIKENMKAQKVCDVSHITIRRDGQCQRYGHSKNVCWGQPTCTRCGELGHDSADCTKKEQCLNCKGEHPATAVKIKENISYPEARRVLLSRRPVSGKSYVSAARKSTPDKCIQCDYKKDNSSDSATPTNPESDSPKKPKSRKACQRDQRPTLARIPKKISRDFHRKIEQDTLTGDCSEEDEALMDTQSGPSTSSSGGGETFLKRTMTMRVRGYNCVRRDVDGDASPTGGATKNRVERTPINFRCRQPLPYYCDFDMCELKRVLSSAHNTSSGPDGISYELLHHLNEDSLISLLYLFNRIWREQVYPTQGQEAIVIPILKPGKDPKDPLSYRPIALTSCLCKTLEHMVNARFVYQLEKHRCIPLFQSGFRKGRSTLDNIIMLKNKASFYVDDLQISCEGSGMRMIERQLQTAVNNIVKWRDTNGHSISASKSCCVHFCRKLGIHPDPDAYKFP
ncbi:putative RNA-directed DNA polymerase from transposon X-element [Trichonephila clavipes]|nr:putative RNA-directed DNA polymerase from transposon X-element [Trichonephila clavipes]